MSTLVSGASGAMVLIMLPLGMMTVLGFFAK